MEDKEKLSILFHYKSMGGTQFSALLEVQGVPEKTLHFYRPKFKVFA